MTYTEDDLWNLLREAGDMPYGAAQIALAEQVIAHADALHAANLSFRARMFATNAYVYGGEPAKSFVTFSWCLTEYDRDPAVYRSSTHTLMWHFKYMVSALRKFPEIPLMRTYAVLDDMERRWRDGGHSLHAVYSYRHSVAQHIGDVGAAESYYELWSTTPRDALSDCIGCDPTSKAAHLVWRGRDADAIALAEPVLDGRMSCSEQPQSILTELMLPYLRTGRVDEARDAHRRAYRLMRPNLADLAEIATHVEFCARTGNEARGLEIVERHLPWLDTAPSPYAAMMFAASAALLLTRVREAGYGDRAVHRPAHGDRPAGSFPVSQLADEMTELARRIAAAFDARNATTEVSREIESTLAAVPIVDSLPISPAASSLEPERPAAPAAAEPIVVEIPDDATADDLLDLAEEHAKTERSPELSAVVAVFDDRFAGTELTVAQRARRASLHGIVAANGGDLGSAEIAWTSALDLFASAGDQLRLQTTRSRLGLLMCRTDRSDIGLPLIADATDYLIANGPADRAASTYRRFAFALVSAGRPDSALESLDNASAVAEHANDDWIADKIAVDRAGVLAEAGRSGEAQEQAMTARDACRESGYRAGLAAACWIIGRIAQMNDDLAGALTAYNEALEAADDPAMIREIRSHRASMLSRTNLAADAVDDLIEQIRTAPDQDTARAARYHLSTAYLNSDRALDAAEVAEEALAQAGEHDAVPALRYNLANAYEQLNQPDMAIEQLELLITAAIEADDQGFVGETMERIGELLDKLDRDALAATRFSDAAHAFRVADRPLDAVRAGRRAAVSHMWARALDTAAELLADVDLAALDLPDDPAASWERAMLASDGARILTRRGETSAAVIRSAPAAAIFRAVGDDGAAAYAIAVHGELLLQDERPAEAEEILRAALPEAHERVAKRMAGSLAAALDALDRGDEAEAIRTEHGLSGA